MLRGLSAILVVVGHMADKVDGFKVHKSHVQNLITNWATEAVLVFFILSGIVIHASISEKPTSPRIFLAKRFRRIHPILFIAVLITLAVEKGVFHATPDAAVIVGNLLPVSTLQGNLVSVFWNSNPVIWSLSFEVFFYVVFSLAISGDGKIRKFVIYLWLALGLISLYVFACLPVSGNVPRYLILMLAYSPIWLIGFFIWGLKDHVCVSFPLAAFSALCLPIASRTHFLDDFYDPVKYLFFAILSVPFFLFLIQDHLKPKSVQFPLFLVVITAYLAAIIMMVGNNDYPPISKYLYIALPFLALPTYFSTVQMIVRKVYNRWIRPIFSFLGELSYSMYLIHFPLLMLIYNMLPYTLAVKTVLFLASLFLISFVLEKRFQILVNKWIPLRG